MKLIFHLTAVVYHPKEDKVIIIHGPLPEMEINLKEILNSIKL